MSHGSRFHFELPSIPEFSFFQDGDLFADYRAFWQFLRRYSKNRTYQQFRKFEVFKDSIVDLLYKNRGRNVRPFMHLGTIGLVFVVITIGPVVFAQSSDQAPDAEAGVLVAEAYESFSTQASSEVQQYRGGEITEHVVTEGETLDDVAIRFNLQPETLRWENNLGSSEKITTGQVLRILPIDGVRHKVSRGETIYTVGKKYGLDSEEAQRIVDYPFNEFRDDDFGLVTGQYLMVPGGVPAQRGNPAPALQFTPVFTPSAGAVAGSGNYGWPAAGRITQGYFFYHKAIDIASGSGGPILAADSGTVVVAGWADNSGYGNRVMIDHSNGDITLYGHMSVVQVQVGQTVNRGDLLGQMGSTGRSTGTHLHFEIRRAGQLLNPLAFLQ